MKHMKATIHFDAPDDWDEEPTLRTFLECEMSWYYNVKVSIVKDDQEYG